MKWSTSAFSGSCLLFITFANLLMKNKSKRMKTKPLIIAKKKIPTTIAKKMKTFFRLMEILKMRIKSYWGITQSNRSS